MIFLFVTLTEAWFTRDAAEAARHLRQLRLDRLSFHT